jgi:hypothetical protein
MLICPKGTIFGDCFLYFVISSICFRLYMVYVRFEIFTAATMKSGVFWDVTPRGSCKNRRFGGILRLLHQGDKNR